MSISTSGNDLVLSGSFNREALQRSCAAIHNLRKQGCTSVNIDMTKLATGFAADLLPFATHCRALLIDGFGAFLRLPEDPKFSRLFVNSNWAHLIDPRQFDPSSFASNKHLPAMIYVDAETHYQSVNQIMNKLLGSLEGFSRDQLAALEWAVNEITDNVLNHADSRVGGVVQLTTFSKSGIVEFIVCDTGVGIPKTLRDAHVHLTSDVDALDRAIREGVTRNRQTNMGNGLFGSYRISQLSNGYFSIYSGYAMLSLTKKAGLHVAKQAIPYQGTAIVCGIATDNPNLLSEALAFKGEKYTPGYSYVDKLVEDGGATIVLTNEAKSFGSRDVAKPVRIKIENLLSAAPERVEIVLDDVALISSSFADEVFGKLFVQLGPITFMNRLKISGGNNVVRQLIDRAITQRVALGKNSPYG
ncbi:MAG: DUF4325 domain-containing protein [Hyphomicrobiaceae bacterium]|nr:DUF4325 domain-containing protein [Hyphomicrobiaceae bacterium]